MQGSMPYGHTFKVHDDGGCQGVCGKLWAEGVSGCSVSWALCILKTLILHYTQMGLNLYIPMSSISFHRNYVFVHWPTFYL